MASAVICRPPVAHPLTRPHPGTAEANCAVVHAYQQRFFSAQGYGTQPVFDAYDSCVLPNNGVQPKDEELREG